MPKYFDYISYLAVIFSLAAMYLIFSGSIFRYDGFMNDVSLGAYFLGLAFILGSMGNLSKLSKKDLKLLENPKKFKGIVLYLKISATLAFFVCIFFISLKFIVPNKNTEIFYNLGMSLIPVAFGVLFELKQLYEKFLVYNKKVIHVKNKMVTMPKYFHYLHYLYYILFPPAVYLVFAGSLLDSHSLFDVSLGIYLLGLAMLFNSMMDSKKLSKKDKKLLEDAKKFKLIAFYLGFVTIVMFLVCIYFITAKWIYPERSVATMEFFHKLGFDAIPLALALLFELKRHYDKRIIFEIEKERVDNVIVY